MLVLLACQLSLVEQYDGRREIFELGFCSEPVSLSLAEQYDGRSDGDKETTVLYTLLCYTVSATDIHSDCYSSE